MRCRRIARPVQVALQFSRSGLQCFPHGLGDGPLFRLPLEEALSIGELHKRRHLLFLGRLSVHARSVIEVGGVKELPL